MPELALKVETQKKNPETGHSIVHQQERVLNPFPLSRDYFVIHRKPTCPCDGGCPRCIPLQPKLRVGEPDDEYEKEADRVAEQVMRMPEPAIQRKRKCTSDSDLSCKEDEEEELKERTLMKKGTPGKIGSSSVPPVVHDVLQSPGQPLDASTRTFFEPQFGYDFSGVRVHTGEKAAESARAVDALAYTVGKDVVFGAGSVADRKLLAHEMVHVMQQGRSRWVQAPAIQRVEGGQWREEHEAAKRAAAAAAASARIEGDTEYWEGFALRPDEQTLEMVLKAVIAEKGFKGALNFIMNYRFRFGWSPEQAALRERIIPILEKKLNDLKDYGKRKVEEFGPEAIKDLKLVLEDSKKVVDKEAEKYGLKTSRSFYPIYGGGITVSSYSLAENKETGDMVNAAKDILNKFNELTALNKKRESYEEKTYACTDVVESGMRLRCNRMSVASITIKDPVAHKQVCADIEKAQQGYMVLRVQRESQYPVLASFRPLEGLSQLKVIAEGSKASRDEVIGLDIAEKLKNIDEIRKVADDNKFVWKQESIINGTKRRLNYKPGSIEARAVDAKVQEVEHSEMLRNLTLGFISLVGALMAAIPSGGSSLVAWGAGGAGVGLLAGAGGVSLYEGIREYQIQKAATGNTFDRAQAISQEDPSFFWLAFLIATSIVDIALAAGKFVKAVRAIRAVGKADLDDMARTAYRSSGLEGAVPEEEFVQNYKANMKVQAETPKTEIYGEEPKMKAPGEGLTIETSVETPRKLAEPPGVPAILKLPKSGTILARGASEESVKEVYFQAARQSAPEGVEVGIFRRRLPDGSDEYAVVQGYKGGVSNPGDEWSNVSHYHPGAEGKPGFQNPAPQDISISLREHVRRPPGEKGPFTQKVHSQSPDGRIIEVEYGVDPEKGQYFVKRPGQPPKYFVDTYPHSITPLVNDANAIADPEKRLQELIKIYKTLDPDKYYAGWYACQF